MHDSALAPPRRFSGRRALRLGLFAANADAWKAAEDALDAAEALVRRSEDRDGAADNERILGIRSYIAQNYADTELTVQRIAEQFGLSVSNLSHYFKKYTGATVSEVLLAHRIDAARKLLAGTDLSVNEVALRAGYSQAATFTRAFRKAAGLSPLAYREEARAGGAPAAPEIEGAAEKT